MSYVCYEGGLPSLDTTKMLAVLSGANSHNRIKGYIVSYSLNNMRLKLT